MIDDYWLEECLGQKPSHANPRAPRGFPKHVYFKVPGESPKQEASELQEQCRQQYLQLSTRAEQCRERLGWDTIDKQSLQEQADLDTIGA